MTKRTIPYGKQHGDEDDLRAVAEVLRSDWWTQGPAVRRFEDAIASQCSVGHAVAVSNGTAALHVAYQGVGLGPGDVLWTVPNTFVATANAALMCGADVDFVDIDAATGNMDVAQLQDKLAEADANGKLPKVVVPVHFSGASCDMESIHGLAERYGFKLVEDACHALGATYQDSPVGSCAFSDAAVFSFHPVKTIAAGEGGMITTGDASLADDLRLFSSHGITRDPSRMTGESLDPWYYEQILLGGNYRLSDLHAALGASQMKKISAFLKKRRAIAARYATLLDGIPGVRKPIQDDGSSWHLYVVNITETNPVGRDDILRRLHGAGIRATVHYIPVHLQPFYRARGFGPGQFPVAETHSRQAISLPIFFDLSDEDQRYVVECLAHAMSE